jgi:hypothetical protein
MGDKVRQKWWSGTLDSVMHEIMREASICEVKLLDPGVIEAVLANNESVCGHANSMAFKKLRELLMMGLVMREKAVDKLGPDETAEMLAEIRERLLPRFGDRLGGPPQA